MMHHTSPNIDAQKSVNPITVSPSKVEKASTFDTQVPQDMEMIENLDQTEGQISQISPFAIFSQVFQEIKGQSSMPDAASSQEAKELPSDMPLAETGSKALLDSADIDSNTFLAQINTPITAFPVLTSVEKLEKSSESPVLDRDEVPAELLQSVLSEIENVQANTQSKSNLKDSVVSQVDQDQRPESKIGAPLNAMAIVSQEAKSVPHSVQRSQGESGEAANIDELEDSASILGVSLSQNPLSNGVQEGPVKQAIESLYAKKSTPSMVISQAPTQNRQQAKSKGEEVATLVSYEGDGEAEKVETGITFAQKMPHLGNNAPASATHTANTAAFMIANQHQQRVMEQLQRQQTSLRQQHELKEASVSNDETVQGQLTSASSVFDGSGLDKVPSTPIQYASITHAITSKKWGEALGKHLQVAANQSLQKMQITLNPEKLGPIQVNLHLSKDKQLHIGLAAHHAVTREAMLEALPRLKEMLECQGVSLGSMDVSEESFTDQNFTENQKSQNARSGTRSVQEGDDLTEQTISSSQLLKAADEAGRVDYYA